MDNTSRRTTALRLVFLAAGAGYLSLALPTEGSEQVQVVVDSKTPRAPHATGVETTSVPSYVQELVAEYRLGK